MRSEIAVGHPAGGARDRADRGGQPRALPEPEDDAEHATEHKHYDHQVSVGCELLLCQLESVARLVLERCLQCCQLAERAFVRQIDWTVLLSGGERLHVTVR